MQIQEAVEYKQFSFDQVELVETDEAWIVKGWAATYAPDRELDVFHPGAFWRSVKKRHDDMMASRGVSGVKFLFAHKQDVIIGTPLVMREDLKKGLWVEASFLKDDDFPEARRAWKLAKLMLLDAFSVGYTVVRANPMAKVKGQKRDIFEADILEFSLLSIPMNETATVEEVKSLDNETIPNHTEEETPMTELEMKSLSDLIVAAVKDAVREELSLVAAQAPADVEVKAVEAEVEEPGEVEVSLTPEQVQDVMEQVAQGSSGAVEDCGAGCAVEYKSVQEIVEIKSMLCELLEWKNAQGTVEVKAVEVEIPETDNLVEEKGYLASLRELQAIFCEGKAQE